MTVSRSVWVVGLGLLGLASCVTTGKTPATTVQQENPQCQGTEPGRGCLTLEFSVSDTVRKDTKQPVAGPLHWALYKGGDVKMLGPGDHQPVQSGTIPHVDLNSPGATTQVTVPNVVAQSYQVLAYIDETNSGTGTAESGDAVTIPSHPFSVPADKHTSASVTFNYIR